MQQEKVPRTGAMALPKLVRTFERICIVEAMRMSNHDAEVAAKVLKISVDEIEKRRKALKMDEREAPDEPVKPKPASWNSVES